MKVSLPCVRESILPPGVMGLGLFLMIGWNLIKMGRDLYKSGEVSPTLQMPFYPVVYGVGFAALIQVWFWRGIS